MIHVEVEQGIAYVSPKGHYAQAEFAEAVERALTLCPEGSARGLIMDFSSAHGVETHSIVRVRETARHLAQNGARYHWRVAVIAPTEGVARLLQVGGAVSRGHGIEYEFCRDVVDARSWILNPANARASA
ncbi:MAG: hypothetical protein JWL95_1557 [Gemmatimonadetes bacterium]|nr:hypothetical protein [Gemmatimonadota bacterium]